MSNSPDPTRRSNSSRQAILDAAAELIAELGFRRLTIEAIAVRAGVGKQTIYRWWPSKGAVVFDALLALQHDADGVRMPESGDLGADLRLLLRETAAGLVDPHLEEPYRAVLTEIQHDPVLAEELRERLLGPLLSATRDWIRRAQDRCQINAATDPAVVVDVLYGPLFYRWLLRTGPLDDDYLQALTAAVLPVITASSGPHPPRAPVEGSPPVVAGIED